MNNIQQRFDKIVKENLKVKNINQNDSFYYLGADSLDKVEILMAVEEEFNIEIADEEAEQIKTIGDAVIYIKKRLEK